MKIMAELIKTALLARLSVKYTLFGSWFSSPNTITTLKNCGLDTIAMIKKSNKIKYGYQGGWFSIKEIYSKSQKRRGYSKHLPSVDVTIRDEVIPTKIVCIRNKGRKKEWLAIISTG